MKIITSQNSTPPTYLKLESIEGKYGKFNAYTIKGNTYPIREQLKSLGFGWSGSRSAWWLSEKKMNDRENN